MRLFLVWRKAAGTTNPQFLLVSIRWSQALENHLTISMNSRHSAFHCYPVLYLHPTLACPQFISAFFNWGKTNFCSTEWLWNDTYKPIEKFASDVHCTTRGCNGGATKYWTHTISWLWWDESFDLIIFSPLIFKDFEDVFRIIIPWLRRKWVHGV